MQILISRHLNYWRRNNFSRNYLTVEYNWLELQNSIKIEAIIEVDWIIEYVRNDVPLNWKSSMTFISFSIDKTLYFLFNISVFEDNCHILNSHSIIISVNKEENIYKEKLGKKKENIKSKIETKEKRSRRKG